MNHRLFRFYSSTKFLALMPIPLDPPLNPPARPLGSLLSLEEAACGAGGVGGSQFFATSLTGSVSLSSLGEAVIPAHQRSAAGSQSRGEWACFGRRVPHTLPRARQKKEKKEKKTCKPAQASDPIEWVWFKSEPLAVQSGLSIFVCASVMISLNRGGPDYCWRLGFVSHEGLKRVHRKPFKPLNHILDHSLMWRVRETSWTQGSACSFRLESFFSLSY